MNGHLVLGHRRRRPVCGVGHRPSRGRSSSGVAVVETAFVVPVFLLLFVGVADLGMGALQSSQASSAAVDAARVGVVMATPPDTANCALDPGYQRIIAVANARIPRRTLGCENVVITCATPTGAAVNCVAADTLNDRMTVTVRWTWEAFSPVGQAAPIDEIVGRSTMRFIPQPAAPTSTTFPIP